MRSANHSAPLQGLRLYKALLGLIQASGLAGGFDLQPFGLHGVYGASPRYPVVLGFATLRVVRFFWQCLLGGRLGPPFFPAGKESAAGGVKKGGQGGLPMGPLDDPPTANKGGVRAPFFGLIPRGSVGAVPCECAGGASRRCFVLRRGKALRCCPFFVGSWFLGGAVPAKT